MHVTPAAASAQRARRRPVAAHPRPPITRRSSPTLPFSESRKLVTRFHPSSHPLRPSAAAMGHLHQVRCLPGPPPLLLCSPAGSPSRAGVMHERPPSAASKAGRPAAGPAPTCARPAAACAGHLLCHRDEAGGPHRGRGRGGVHLVQAPVAPRLLDEWCGACAAGSAGPRCTPPCCAPGAAPSCCALNPARVLGPLVAQRSGWMLKRR